MALGSRSIIAGYRESGGGSEFKSFGTWQITTFASARVHGQRRATTRAARPRYSCLAFIEEARLRCFRSADCAELIRCKHRPQSARAESSDNRCSFAATRGSPVTCTAAVLPR
jgi:hypothetical protein